MFSFVDDTRDFVHYVATALLPYGEDASPTTVESDLATVAMNHLTLE